jgi:hypothetical protein
MASNSSQASNKLTIELDVHDYSHEIALCVHDISFQCLFHRFSLIYRPEYT